MSATEPMVELDQRFSRKGATTTPWSEVASILEQSEIFWLSTMGRDGRPHVTRSRNVARLRLALLHRPGRAEARNIEVNPQCILTTGGNAFRFGPDVVVEGRATRVTDESLLERLAAMWKSKLHWPFDVVDAGFRGRTSEIAGEEFDAKG